jgi:hypothetical protein
MNPDEPPDLRVLILIGAIVFGLMVLGMCCLVPFLPLLRGIKF